MYPFLLLKGLLIGFCVAAPVGPIGVLCIRRCLHEGKRSGLVTGLGAAFADGLYGLVAAFGVSSVSYLLVEHRFWFRLIGSLFLLYLGIRTIKAVTPLQAPPSRLEDIVGDFSSSFLLTLANPITIVVFGALFVELGLRSLTRTPLGNVYMVLGVTLGSVLWWFLLCTIVDKLREYITPRSLRVINVISGTAILAIAVFGLARVVQSVL